MELIKDFQKEQALHKHIALNLIGFKENYDIHNYINFINVTTYDIQSTLTPHAVLKILKEGNDRFLQDIRIHRSPKIDIRYTAEAQHPMAVVLGCIDSRVPVETIFDMSFGDLFCVRIAGNIVNNDILASIEFACHMAGAKLIVILGHTSCGAIKAACDHVQEGFVTELLAKIKPALNAEKLTIQDRTSANTDFVRHITHLNIANTIYEIYTKSDILRKMIDNYSIGIIGANYQVETGEVILNDFSAELSQISTVSIPIIKAIHQLQQAKDTEGREEISKIK